MARENLVYQPIPRENRGLIAGQDWIGWRPREWCYSPGTTADVARGGQARPRFELHLNQTNHAQDPLCRT